MRHSPRLLFWETTKACNLGCRHCRAVPCTERSDDELDTNEARALIEAAADLGVRIFVFSGGEPLLRDDLFELIQRARETGMSTAVATNGTLLTKEIVQRFVALEVARVSVSIDGATAAVHDAFRGVVGSFDAAMNGIDLLRRYGQPFQVNTSVSRGNERDLTEIIDMAEAAGAEAVHLFFLVPVGCGAEIGPEERISPQRYEELLEWFATEREQRTTELRSTCAPHLVRVVAQRKGGAAGSNGSRSGHAASHGTKGCLAGTQIVFVGSRGEVQPCGYMSLEIGNVRSSALKDLWRESEILEGLRDASRLTGACGSCVYKNSCGGCRARALAVSGDLYAEEPMCAWGKENRNGG